MESSLGVYAPLMEELAEDEAARKIRILGFRYPADESLARSAKFLRHEMRRVGADQATVDFVCHSAGGLVARHYCEVDGGKFQRILFQGTPHYGSDLAALRSLLEVGQFVGDLKLGYDAALAKAIGDGHGQMSHDLMPESLFLTHLNAPRQDAARDKYVIYRGKAFSGVRVVLVKATVRTAAVALAGTQDESGVDNTLTKFGRAALGKFVVPAEITDGDLCVTCESAHLNGVEKVLDFELSHTKLPRDAQVIEDVVQRLVADSQP
jgi:hypothetical protein